MKYLIIFILLCNNLFAQVINNTKIVINDGSYVVVNKDFKNNGNIDLDGTIILKGDWTNTSNNSFYNIESIPDGEIIFNGDAQYIKGTPSIFENITLEYNQKHLLEDSINIKGILKLNSIFYLNENTVVLNSISPNSIEYLGGYIYSENENSKVRWYANELSLYNIPFGNSYNHLNVLFKIDTLYSYGYVDFSTYPTDCDNLPLPTNINLDDPIDKVANRFWVIDAMCDMKPTIELGLTYSDLDMTCNKINYVKIMTYVDEWNKFNSVESNHIVSSKMSLYGKYWGLVDGDDFKVYIPNAFHPNGDGVNEYFTIFGEDVKDYKFHMTIYNRWVKLYSKL